MSILVPHISFKRRLFSSSGWAFFTMLVWECVESLLEYAIAYVISSAITMLVIKLVATFLIITATQVASKQLQRFIMTLVKKLTYQKGEDKVEILKKFWEFLKANKCSLISIVSAVLLAAGGTCVIDVENLPQIPLGKGEVIEAVIQEEDLIATEIVYGKEAVVATEIVYGKEAVIATETVYGEPIFATEIVWEKEPVLATETVWEKEPIVATEIIYSVEPVIADKLTFIANAVIYENGSNTIKYNIGDVVLNSEVSLYLDKVDVFQVGDTIKEGVILYDIGDIIKDGVVKYNVGDVIEEGVIKYDIGDYMGNEVLYNVGDVIVPAEILYNVGDIIEPAEILYNVGDVIIAKGTVLEEAKTVAPINATPYIYYALLAIVVGLCGTFFENPKDYAERKEKEGLKKEAKKELKEEAKKEVNEKEQSIVAQEQKVAEAEKAKADAERRAKIDAVKAAMKAEKAN